MALARPPEREEGAGRQMETKRGEIKSERGGAGSIEEE
jgi:hypothetical protein